MQSKWNSNVIKLIAIIAMTIDHTTWMLIPSFSRDPLPLILHSFGRITCPIMCYFIAEGYHYTKNISKYTRRLLLFALISHFPYKFMSMDFVDWKSLIPFYYGNVVNQTSVIWPLAIGLIMLRVYDSKKIKRDFVKLICILLLCVVAFPSDWSCIASVCILGFGIHRGNLKKQILWMLFFVAIYAMIYGVVIDPVYGLLQMNVVLAIPFLLLYNGERGKNPKVNHFMKWFFYLYYPAHILVIAWIQYIRK